MRVWAEVVDALERGERCALVTVAAIHGSAPREPGARMVIRPDGTFRGTIGGGELEWRAVAAAREAIAGTGPRAVLARFTLGPDLGQCCGGTLRLLTEVFDPARLDEVRGLAAREARGPFTTDGCIERDAVHRTAVTQAPAGSAQAALEGTSRIVEHFSAAPRGVLLFGAGHVGRALMLALAPLPFAVRWIDERASAFPAAVPANVTVEFTEVPEDAIGCAPADAFVVVMTHSHARDLAIVHAALAADRFGYVGLIGSRSKRGRFVHRLREAGIAEDRIASLACPIGSGSIRSKLPAAIAVGIAAQLLERDEAIARAVLAPARLEAVQ